MMLGAAAILALATASSSRQVEDHGALLDLLRSAEFEGRYFEQRPLLLQVADGSAVGWRLAPGVGGSSGLSLATVLQQPTWRYEAVAPTDGHHRSLLFKRGSFLPSGAATGWRRGDEVFPEDIEEALAAHGTMVAHGAQLWSQPVATLTLELSRVFSRIVNTNVYITGPGTEVSMAPHNDLQCTLIFQVEGSKRWQLWEVPQVMLARSPRETVGKAPNRVLDASKLGPPLLDVVLEPGHVLYVPRGVVHATSTADLATTSLHLTVGLEASFGWTVEGFVGAGAPPMAEAAQGARFQAALAQALTTVANRNRALRQSITPSQLRRHQQEQAGAAKPDKAGAGAEDTQVGEEAGGEGEGGGWRELLASALHSAVDELVANTGFVPTVAAEMEGELRRWRAAIADLHEGCEAF
jgi:hypothetical protein